MLTRIYIEVLTSPLIPTLGQKQRRNSKHLAIALPWRKKWTNLPFRVLQKPAGRTQHTHHVPMKKIHVKETREGCDTCPQQLLTLPDTPQPHCEKTPTCE